MVVIHLAYTVPVNPTGASPVLTQAQVFAGFRRKIRRPGDFVPAIETSEILSDDAGIVKRRVTFKATTDGAVAGGIPRQMVEVCKELPPSRVDYELEDGSSILNIVSTGASGQPEDLFLTYVFAWKHDDLEEGSAAALAAEEQHKEIAKAAVVSSVATTRKLASAGEI